MATSHTVHVNRRPKRGSKRPPQPLPEDTGEIRSIVTHDAAFIEPLGSEEEQARHARISEAAYYLAERRSFDPGHELDDWLEAEREIERAQESGESPHLCGD